jgi:Helicase conserved C-terminal domain/DNA methylase
MDYSDFLANKIVQVAPLGFPATALPPALKPFQQELVTWACERGRAAVFAERGLGKMLIELSWAAQVAAHTGRPALILAPLAVGWQLDAEAKRFGIDAGLIVNGALPYAPVMITNYERLSHIDPTIFSGVALDEASILKNFTGKTKTELVDAFSSTPYRLAATATPSPNDIVELGNHATQAQTFRLKRHGEREFWAWMASWARALRLPSDLDPAYSDEGYLRPEPVYHVHTVQTDHSAAAEEEGSLFRATSGSATSLHKELGATLKERSQVTADLALAEPDQRWIIWVHTNAEADAVCKLLPDAVEVRGNMSADEKESRLNAFAAGQTRLLVTKPSIAGLGLNLQVASRMTFASLNHSFEEFWQCIGRTDRYGNPERTQVHIVTTDTYSSVLGNVRRKQAAHEAMQAHMIEATRTARTGQANLAMTVGDEFSRTKTGPGWTIHNGDCVAVTAQLRSNSHDFQIFSPPFSTQYSYSPSLRDMGNTDDDAHFFQHFGYLIPELRRTLKVGRLCAVHVKNQQVYASSEGYSGLRDFRGDVIRAFLEAAPGQDGSFWSYHSEVCIWTDPVREMQRTKADGLLYKNIRTNAAKNRQGMAEYVLVFRKWLPGEMDSATRVTHDPAEFTLDMWQRYASPVWMDILRTDVLNARIASVDGDEKHLAPLQLEIVRRCVQLWTNPGDLVFSPFAGVASEGYGALQVGRSFEGVELKSSYFDWGVKHLTQIAQHASGQLFQNAEVWA